MDTDTLLTEKPFTNLPQKRVDLSMVARKNISIYQINRLRL
ncbi:hypothetical protein BROOK1789B_759 [Bathymodiolus brooksi thiotrophic gill symbiont]|nr:hypothetical protein BROOK1789B_759 [Bathymodiolus brooksi thiotrophic gill symbiont]